MASIFRKLTGRRKKTKPTIAALSANTSTESSHASEFDKAAKRPQHYLADHHHNNSNNHHKTALPLVKESSPAPPPQDPVNRNNHNSEHYRTEQSRRRSRSRSFDRSVPPATKSTTNKTNREDVDRKQHEQHFGSGSLHNSTGNTNTNASVHAHAHEDKAGNRRYRFSFPQPKSVQDIISKSGCPATSDDTTTAAEDNHHHNNHHTTIPPHKRGRRPLIKEDHEVFAPPGAHATPKNLKSQQVKVKKANRQRQRERERQRERQLTAQSKKGHQRTISRVAKGKVTPELTRTAVGSSSAPRKTSPTSTLATTTTSISTASQHSSRPLSPEDEKQLAINKETERVARAATALDNRGNEYFERGYYDKAMEAYSRALKLKRRTFHSMLEEADDLFDEAEDNEKLDSGEMDPKLLVSMATSINNIGYLRQRAGEATPDETMAAYKKSLRIKRKILGNDSLSVGKTLNNIGSVYYLKKEFQGALPAYEEAFQIMLCNLGEDHPDVATVMSNMGDVCLAMNEKAKSLERYRRALNIRWNAFGEKDPRTMRLLEKIARIEIGDKMPTPRGTGNIQNQVYDWDESELYDLDLRPISFELRLLKDQVQADLHSVDILEKKMAVGMLQDKVKIVRGMRELAEAQKRGNGSFRGLEESFSYDSSHHDESNREGSDTAFSPMITPVPMEARSDAQNHIKERLAKLRSEKNISVPIQTAEQIENPNAPTLNDSVSKLDPGSSALLRTAFISPDQQRPALSSLQPQEIKDAAHDIKSALKLKKGIDTLRSFEEPQEKQQQVQGPKMIHATWLGEVEN